MESSPQKISLEVIYTCDAQITSRIVAATRRTPAPPSGATAARSKLLQTDLTSFRNNEYIAIFVRNRSLLYGGTARQLHAGEQ
eukprot:6213662-Pleurochrysis_carterae.AAC.3